LFLGSCFEGESIVLFFSAMAYKGYFSFPAVLAIAFTATLLADQTLFYAGRHFGPKLLNRKPEWQERVDKIFRLLHQYNIWFILSFRFIYGIRTLSPLVIGASGFNRKRFAILNFIAAAIWAALSCTTGYLIGYFFGDALEALIEKAIKYQKIFILSLIGLIVLVILARKGWQHYQCKKTDKKTIDKG
jgi:membrane protein DedA with SNARE-associated domain